MSAIIITPTELFKLWCDRMPKETDPDALDYVVGDVPPASGWVECQECYHSWHVKYYNPQGQECKCGSSDTLFMDDQTYNEVYGEPL